MTWDFTPEQVMKGEANYSFDDFRRDLLGQVKHNFEGRMEPDKMEDCFSLFWLFCHYQAIMLSSEEIGEKLAMDAEGVMMMSEICGDDGKMLAAIYQNLFLMYFEAALRDSWGDEDKAMDRTLALVNRYIQQHLKI